MIKSLWVKFVVLLFSVSVVSLSASLYLREMIIKDFEEYLEGETEDRIYRVTAAIEGTYEKYAGWSEDALKENAIWALLLGYEVKILGTDNHELMNTTKAVESLSPLMKRRITAISGLSAGDEGLGGGIFMNYPLFLAGKDIGYLEVKPVKPKEGQGKDIIFMIRSNRFLLLSLFIVGGLSTVVSLVFSRKLTDPIKKLTSAAKDISEGNIKSRVLVCGNDEISNLAKTFNAMAGNLEVQESLRRRLNANIAHELRTPLSVMQGELEGMIDGLIKIDNDRLLSLHEEAGRLKTIIEGFEELARAEASILHLKKQSIHLRPFLTHIKERFEKLFNDRGILLFLECDDASSLYADPDKISQIVINLLTNSLKATEKGGRVGIRGGIKAGEGYIEVTDTGIGVKEEEMSFLFERFYKKTAGGLGIGLAIARELAEAHGGRLEVRSEYGKGATFTLSIPEFTISS
jgi:two-component system, OmpR family, sensor histidine kinase BaeS